MYNLFVTYNCEAWEGNPAEFDLARCLREYTTEDLRTQYQGLRSEDIAALMNLPCLFAYEDHCAKDARVGRLTRIRTKGTTVRIEYEILPDAPAVTMADLGKFSWDFGIGNWEMNRTHWALKEESLEEALHNAGIKLAPNLVPGAPIDITRHIFDISLSFPGDERPYVESVYRELTKDTRATIFYDDSFKAQLARPNLDTLLQEIYGVRSMLVVVFLGESYAQKEWCGIEFRAVKEIIKAKKDTMVMFVRHDKGKVPGVFSTDGYIDAKTHSPADVAALILERFRLHQLAFKDPSTTAQPVVPSSVAALQPPEPEPIGMKAGELTSRRDHTIVAIGSSKITVQPLFFRLQVAAAGRRSVRECRAYGRDEWRTDSGGWRGGPRYQV